MLVLLNVELDPSLYDLVTLLIRCNLPGNLIEAQPSSALERSAWTVLSPDLSMRFFSRLLLDPSGYVFKVVQYYSTCDRSYRYLPRHSLTKQ